MAVQAQQHLLLSHDAFGHAFRALDGAGGVFLDELGIAGCAPAAAAPGPAGDAVFGGAARSELTCNGGGEHDAGLLLPRKRARVAAGLVECGGQQGGLVLPLAPPPPPHVQAFAGDVRARAVGCGAASTSGRAAASNGVLSHLYHQGVEIDTLVRLETERMRVGLQEKRRRHARAVVAAVGRAAAGRLRAAEAELDRARCRNAELEERLRWRPWLPATLGFLCGRHAGRARADGRQGGRMRLPLQLLEAPRKYSISTTVDARQIAFASSICLPPVEVSLMLRAMPYLETISGGPFPLLVKLSMCELPRLEEVWMVAERTMPDEEEGGGCSNSTPHTGQVRVGSCLSKLEILKCPSLKVKPYLPSSLHKLMLCGCTEQLLQSSNFSQLKKLVVWGNGGLGSGRGWELLHPMTALESLEIQHSSGLIELPESLGNLKSLRSLEVFACSAIRMLPMSLGELPSLQELTITICHCFESFPQSIGRLTSLQLPKIVMCGALQQLPECLGGLRSLRKLCLSRLPLLTCIPQSICHLTSLKVFLIGCCPGIKSLPEGVKGLTALQELDIHGCPNLARHCERRKGEGWHLISHIPHLQIGQEKLDATSSFY